MQNHSWALLLTVMLLAACASLVAPRDLKDQIVYGYGSVHAAATTISTLVDTNQMSPVDAANYTKSLRESKSALDTAWMIYREKPFEAQNKLELANKLLLVVQAELNKLAEKKP